MRASFKTIAAAAAIAAALGAAAFGVNAGTTARADDASKKADAPIASIFAAPKEGGTLSIIASGQADPKTVTVSPDTLITGTCQHCILPIKFKASDAAKNCQPCGCDVTNASCVVGDTVKPATWSAMLRALPYGVALRPTYVDPEKPEAGLKAIAVDLNTVYFAVDGLSSQTPEQVAAAIKPIGAGAVKLTDGGKRLTFAVKDNWSSEREQKLEKLLGKLGGKVLRPDQAAAAQ